METAKFILLCGVVAFLASCSTGNCRSAQIKAEAAGPEVMPKENKLLPAPSQAEHVSVYKLNGSLQCNQGKTIDKATMQKDLKGLVVYKSSIENDGKMRAQVCGGPTGNVNVYEIDKSNLAQAISYGFTEWIR